MKIKANISFDYDIDDKYLIHYEKDSTPYDMVLLDLESDPSAFFQEIYATETLKVEAEIAQDVPSIEIGPQ